MAAVDEFVHVEATGPEELATHGKYYLVRKNAPDQFRLSEHNGQHPLSKQQARSYQLASDAIETIMSDILRQNYYANVRGASYLTERQIDFDLVKSLERPGGRGRSKSLVPTLLSHTVPIVEGVSVSRILALREQEAPAFAYIAKLSPNHLPRPGILERHNGGSYSMIW